jgi:hypothetical protein
MDRRNDPIEEKGTCSRTITSRVTDSMSRDLMRAIALVATLIAILIAGGAGIRLV